jgi:hypothetical protein
MNRAIVAALLTVAGLTLGFGQAEAASRVQVGRLACEVDGGIGYLIGSQKGVTCYFHRDGHPTETYDGSISKLGLDLGVTGRTHIEWLVFAATSTAYTHHALAGDYVGATSEATIGVGLGANWLVGGSHKSFALQPLSVQAQTGLDVTFALASLSLR